MKWRRRTTPLKVVPPVLKPHVTTQLAIDLIFAVTDFTPQQLFSHRLPLWNASEIAKTVQPRIRSTSFRHRTWVASVRSNFKVSHSNSITSSLSFPANSNERTNELTSANPNALLRKDQLQWSILNATVSSKTLPSSIFLSLETPRFRNACVQLW